MSYTHIWSFNNPLNRVENNRVFHGSPTWAQLYCEKLAGNLESKFGTQSRVQVVVTTSIWVPT